MMTLDPSRTIAGTLLTVMVLAAVPAMAQDQPVLKSKPQRVFAPPMTLEISDENAAKVARQVWLNETIWGSLYFRTAIRADAGIPQVTINQSDSVTFDGSKTWANHPDFSLVGSYEWTFMYGGEKETLTGVNPSFKFDLPGEYTVILNVTDGTGQFDTDKVVVYVRDTEGPVANAGQDIIVDQGVEVTFDGSRSTDNHPDFPEGAEFEWSFLTDRLVRLYGITATYTFADAGEYKVELIVTDAAGFKDNDTLWVEVLDTEPPVADAGADVTVDFGRYVNFDAGNSTDNVRIASYEWSFEVDSEVLNLTGTTSKNRYRFPMPGVFNPFD